MAKRKAVSLDGALKDLASDDSKTRAAAVEVLCTEADRDPALVEVCLNTIIAAGSDPKANVRAEVVCALGILCEKDRIPERKREVVDLIGTYLNDVDVLVRREAVIALRDALYYSWKDGSWRTTVTLLLKILKDDAACPQIAITCERFSTAAEEALEPLINALSYNEEYAQEVLAAIASIGAKTPEQLKRIAVFLNHSVPIVRQRAIRAVASAGSVAEPYVKEISAQINNKHFGVKSDVVVALGAIGSTDSIDLLIDCLADPDLRANAASALGKYTSRAIRAVPALTKYIRQGKHEVLEALGAIGNAQAISALVENVLTGEGRVTDQDGTHPGSITPTHLIQALVTPSACAASDESLSALERIRGKDIERAVVLAVLRAVQPHSASRAAVILKLLGAEKSELVAEWLDTSKPYTPEDVRQRYNALAAALT